MAWGKGEHTMARMSLLMSLFPQASNQLSVEKWPRAIFFSSSSSSPSSSSSSSSFPLLFLLIIVPFSARPCGEGGHGQVLLLLLHAKAQFDADDDF